MGAPSTSSPSSATHGQRLVVLLCTLSTILTVVVITSILARLLRSHGTLLKVKRRVSSLPGELVCCVVPRRRRTRGLSSCAKELWVWMDHFLNCIGWHMTSRTSATSRRCLLWLHHGRIMNGSNYCVLKNQ